MRVLDVSPSAGAWMRPYHVKPLRLIPRSVRIGVVRGLARMLPRLFGYQTVVRATID